ncbi:MAG TPA: diguanylate cyclase [Gammaproteobacteria bacterium]|nr:diguanylate cyclase [Gammaproteobacteria bacterium]
MSVLPALLPSLALAAGAWLFGRLLADFTPGQLAVTLWLPAVLFGAGLWLAVRFNRGRLFHALLTLAGAYLVLAWVLPRLAAFDAAVLYAALCLFVPLNLAAFALFDERGALPRLDDPRIHLLGGELLFTLAVLAFEHAGFAAMLDFRFLDGADKGITPVTQPGLLALAGALFVLNGRLFERPTFQRGALFGALVFAAVALHMRDSTPAMIASFAAAAAVLLAAVLQESWGLAYLDPLTELPARRALEEALTRLGERYAIAMLDVDHFKRFNDTYGHHVGDEVLRMVAAHLREIGGGGKPYRYGGEEFAIVFAGASVQDCLPHLERLREEIAEARFELRRSDRRGRRGDGANEAPLARDIAITVSIGIAAAGEGVTAATAVMRAADEALYRAKRNGRNRIEQSPQVTPSEARHG